MLFIIKLLLITGLGLLGSFFMPWWIIILVAFIVAFLFPGNNFNAFLSGLLGGGVLWMAMAWKVDTETASILSSKVVQLFPVSDVNMLIILTGVIGGLSGAFGAFSGNSFRQLFDKKKEKSFYS